MSLDTLTDRYAEASRRWRPARVRVLLVTGAPHRDPARYFYFEDAGHDDLFREVVRTLLGVEKPQRGDKAEHLEQLRDSGVFVIDLRPDPRDHTPLADHVPALIERIREIAPEKIVIIKADVYDAAVEPLAAAGLPVVRARVPYPTAGQQKRFREALAGALGAAPQEGVPASIGAGPPVDPPESPVEEPPGEDAPPIEEPPTKPPRSEPPPRREPGPGEPARREPPAQKPPVEEPPPDRPGKEPPPPYVTSARVTAALRNASSAMASVERPIEETRSPAPPPGPASSTAAGNTSTPSPAASRPEDFSLLSNDDLYLFNEGTHLRLHDKLGAHLVRHHGVAGTVFGVWAPNALAVNVIGSFNGWSPRTHPMRRRGASGIWEAFVPGVGPGELYKFHVTTRHGGVTVDKADPFGFFMQRRPDTASIVFDLDRYDWQDGEWMAARGKRQGLERPIAIYEVHAGSWRRGEDGRWLTWRELADTLVPYAVEMGFTHLELMPISEHPFDGSWGYQTVGYYAPTSRHGTPDDFRAFVDAAHRAGLGVILDWVPAHFPKDQHGLGYFDGTHLYEHADPRKGTHQDWGTFIFNFARPEVMAFLISNALFWLERYHIDGLRVDAVASMLYLDYSRKEGEWEPNQYGGRENLEAIEFLKRFNVAVHREHPGVLTFAEESTAWPLVTRPVHVGGLGFDVKWNMGWMHDVLAYLKLDPILRRLHHDKLTFSLMYAFSENYLLPFSHDEVVHGKGSMLGKMFGDTWRKFAGLRALYGYLYTHPGKKLLFMGNEFGPWREWDHDGALEWDLLEHPHHRGLRDWVKELNRLLASQPALHEQDTVQAGFQWIDVRDVDQSVISFIRRSREARDELVVIVNFTPVPRNDYRIGVPRAGSWRERLNSDATEFGGSGVRNAAPLPTRPGEWHGQPQSLALSVPPLGMVVLEPVPA